MSDRPELDPTNTPWIVSAIVAIFVGVAGAVASVLNKRFDLRIKSTPSWAESMARLDALERDVDEERELRRQAQQAARMARDETRMVKTVFRAFAERVSAQYPAVKLADSERALLESEPEYPDVDSTSSPSA